MYPVVIVGGGPAGSALGCYLSKAGIDNVIFEKVEHPRPHVGESLVTATTRVFHEIGFLETLETEGFVHKYGASWHPPSAKGTVSIEFREFPQEGIAQEYTYHVDRSKMDRLLFEHAATLGSDVHQKATVKEVLFDERGYANGVLVASSGGTRRVPASLVVDATGRGRLLGRQLRIQQNDPVFNQFCVHAWFEDVDRGPAETADHIHIYFLPIERGWAWQIPITGEITSIGVVAEKREFARSKQDREGWFNGQLDTTPEFREAMSGARRINEFKVEADYSYVMDRFCGDGYLLVGDAARFVDPIFSSGVSVALYSAKFASGRIEAAFEAGRFARDVFEPYEKRLKDGVTIWYEFIKLYYKLLPAFTYFILNKRYRQEIFQLLQGEVYDRDVALPCFDAMRSYVRAAEANDRHALHAALDPEIVID